ncbi:hypothetical protein BJV78DRAFT_526497 [Lactifluus subvellereus]|nr:hypothetical protein BJV78DRAFT_526497 [Lactifluus subvellereus]
MSTVLTSFLFLSGFAVAQVIVPNCSWSTLSQWNWTFNSLDQNACTVAGYLESTCNFGSWNITAISAPGNVYLGPSGTDDGNLCKCNTVSYSLLSACSSCQGGSWQYWSEYSFNCTKILAPSSFPNPVPDGIRVPQWALLDVTLENNWDPSKSYAVGGTPEVGPGAILGPSGVTTVSPTTTQLKGTSTSATTPPGPVKKSSAGTIAGVVGGVTATVAAGLAIFWWRRKRTQAVVDGALQAPNGESRLPVSNRVVYMPLSQSVPETPIAIPMKLYDPNDPTTFPEFQGLQGALQREEPMMTSNRSGYTLPTTDPQGYHGYPIV